MWNKQKDMGNNNELVDEKIYWFYRYGMRIVPIVLMIGHWWLTWRFHAGGEEIAIMASGNMAAVKAMYAMAYVVPLVLMLPASYFFGFGWGWRIPFVYLAGVNAVRLMHGSLVATQAMEGADWVLVLLTVMLYVYWGVERILKRV